MTDKKYYIHSMGELKFASPLCTGSAPAILCCYSWQGLRPLPANSASTCSRISQCNFGVQPRNL